MNREQQETAMGHALFDLSGRTALITGSVRGIGYALAQGLAESGARVVVNSRQQAAVDEAVAKLRSLGLDAHGAAFDVAEPAAVTAAFDGFDGLGMEIDILVNNAGIQHVAPVEDFPPEKWDAIIAINLSATFHATRFAVAEMKKKGWGRIINTASAHSLVASPNKSAYVAAKHGIAGFTKTVALETATSGITVNCISPGYVWTPLVEAQIPDTMKARNMTREQVMNDVLLAAQPTKRFVTPEEVAALALYLCREEARSITGANLSIDGGWTAA
jgi:3-hydroxybutyrate dehydrogenase